MQNKNFLPFALPEIGHEEIDAVVEVLKSGWITTGSKAQSFEFNFSEHLGGDVFAVAVNSATAGLHLALEAIGVGPGDEVITTTHTFTATAEVIRYLGSDPVFVDIDESNLCINPNAIESAITHKTRAIIVVHFGGHSAEMDEILRIAEKNNIRVIEDAAHAFPCSYKERMIGQLNSDVTVFSFYANKTMTTGEGGMLVTRDKAISDRAKVMRLHGINRDAFDRFQRKSPAWEYQIVAPGYKYNLTDIAAALGNEQLKKVERFRIRRAEIAEQYNIAFSDLPMVLPPHRSYCKVHAWHLYVVQICDRVKLSRNQFIEELFNLGVGCSVHYIPLHNHPYWKNRYGLSEKMFPVSQRVFERSVSLPIYSLMTDAQVSQVVDAVRRVALC